MGEVEVEGRGGAGHMVGPACCEPVCHGDTMMAIQSVCVCVGGDNDGYPMSFGV